MGILHAIKELHGLNTPVNGASPMHLGRIDVV